ncbi:peptide chain release factor 3, partial [Acinetobacter baumannii]
FVNKMDREARDPFDLLDEIEKTLAIDTTPLTWPIGSGREFAGTYDIARSQVRRLDRDDEPTKVNGPEAGLFDELLPKGADEWREQ